MLAYPNDLLLFRIVYLTKIMWWFHIYSLNQKETHTLFIPVFYENLHPASFSISNKIIDGLIDGFTPRSQTEQQLFIDKYNNVQQA